MFNKISKNKLKNVLLFKYFFNFFIGPFIVIFSMFIVGLIICYILQCLGLVTNEKITLPIIIDAFYYIIHRWEFWFAYGMTFLGNIVGFIHFVILIIDAISGKTVENEIVEVMYAPQCQELFATFFEKKRFLIDTFSRKENCELVVKCYNKKRFYLFWNESYGDKAIYHKFRESEITEITKIKISYFKKSKIIYDLQIVD